MKFTKYNILPINVNTAQRARNNNYVLSCSYIVLLFFCTVVWAMICNALMLFYMDSYFNIKA